MRAFFRWADRFTLAAMVAAACLLFQPWWKPGFPLGFYGLLMATILQIVASHLPREPR